MLLAFEGIDFSGKDTQINRLGRFLSKHGVPHVNMREPGGTDIGESLRNLVLSGGPNSISALAEMFIFLASRAELVDKRIKPELDKGTLVVMNRYIDSTIVYQGHASGIGIENAFRACMIATNKLLPDLTIYLRIDLETLQKRMNSSERKGKDVIESRSLDYYRHLINGYDFLYSNTNYHRRVIQIDATRSKDEVSKDIEGLMKSENLA